MNVRRQKMKVVFAFKELAGTKPRILKKPYGLFPSRTSAALTVTVTLIVIPLSLILWMGNIVVAVVSADDSDSSEDVIPPSRWLCAVCIPVIFALWGYKRNSLSPSGALLGLVVGFTLTISSYAFLACLVTFFVSSSQATKFRSHQKRKFEEHYEEGGKRNWIQVLCNGGMPTLLAMLYILDSGCGERPIDFDKDYHSSWLSLGVLGSFAAACGDTWASELGSVMKSKLPVLITTLKPVPTGTNGGISGPGLWFSFIGGLVIGLAFYITIILTVDKGILDQSHSQWWIIIVGGIAGFVGSILDSYLGATVQYSGVHTKTGIIVEHPGEGIVHISGKKLLDNHSVNLICNIVMGLLTPRIANALWS